MTSLPYDLKAGDLVEFVREVNVVVTLLLSINTQPIIDRKRRVNIDYEKSKK